MPRIEVFCDADALAEQAVRVFIQLANNAIAGQGIFTAALSGGSTPKKIFQRLASQPIDWKRIHLFWVDERCVPPDHLDSNYGMMVGALLDHIDISWRNVHRIPGELACERAAALYELELRRFFGGQIPVFDLILLGLGSDGHTASLFPGSPALLEEESWVVGVQHTSQPLPLVDRVTLTFPVLNEGKNIIFLVSGKEKAGIVARTTRNSIIPDQIPAQKIKSNNKNVQWFVDRAAAGSLPDSIFNV